MSEAIRDPPDDGTFQIRSDLEIPANAFCVRGHLNSWPIELEAFPHAFGRHSLGDVPVYFDTPSDYYGT